VNFNNTYQKPFQKHDITNLAKKYTSVKNKLKNQNFNELIKKTIKEVPNQIRQLNLPNSLEKFQNQLKAAKAYLKQNLSKCIKIFKEFFLKIFLIIKHYSKLAFSTAKNVWNKYLKDKIVLIILFLSMILMFIMCRTCTACLLQISNIFSNMKRCSRLYQKCGKKRYKPLSKR
jgi:hypothetical protein